MKLFSIFALFVAFVEMKTFSEAAKNKDLQTAFVDIANFLAVQNHLVTVVAFENVLNNLSSADIFEATSHIPHRVLYIKSNLLEFYINSSAIASFPSAGSLNQFNNLILVPSTYLVVNQIFVYIQTQPTLKYYQQPAEIHSLII